MKEREWVCEWASVMSENLNVTKNHQIDNSDQQELGINDRNRCVTIPYARSMWTKGRGGYCSSTAPCCGRYVDGICVPLIGTQHSKQTIKLKINSKRFDKGLYLHCHSQYSSRIIEREPKIAPFKLALLSTTQQYVHKWIWWQLQTEAKCHWHCRRFQRYINWTKPHQALCRRSQHVIYLLHFQRTWDKNGPTISVIVRYYSKQQKRKPSWMK